MYTPPPDRAGHAHEDVQTSEARLRGASRGERGRQSGPDTSNRRRSGSRWSRPLPIRMTRASSPSSGSRMLEPRPTVNHGTPASLRERQRGSDIFGPGRQKHGCRSTDPIGRVSPDRLGLPDCCRATRRRRACTNLGLERVNQSTPADISRASACHSCKRPHIAGPAPERDDRVAGGRGRRQGGGVGHPVLQRRPPDERSRPAGSAFPAGC